MHTRLLHQAIELAKANVLNGHGGPYGAIITQDNQIIAASSNQVVRNLDPTAHAEIIAIRIACQQLQDFQLSECILYSSCEPCPMCLGAIYWARLRGVYFACGRQDAAAAHFDDSFIYDQLATAPEKRSITMHHISMPNAQEPFMLWNQKTDKIAY